MKKKITIFTVISALIIGLALHNVVAFKEKIYLALGDSISTGYKLQNADECFVRKVADKCGYTALNYAENGATSETVLDLLKSDKINDKIASADVITITCGGNDMMNLLYQKIANAYNEKSASNVSAQEVLEILSTSSDQRQVSMAITALSVLGGNGEDIKPLFETSDFKERLNQYETKLYEIVSNIKKHNSKARIIITTQYNPYKQFSGMFSVVGKHIDNCLKEINNIILSNSDKLGYEVCDIYTAFSKSSEKLCNADSKKMDLDFHPNAAGHNMISQQITAIILSDNKKDNIVFFKDVNPDDWFYEPVQYVTELKICNGINESEFAPHMPLTRAMFVSMLYRADGSPDTLAKTSFSDVNPEAYYFCAINWAEKNNIVNGVKENLFEPDEYILREQMAVIILRFLNYKSIKSDEIGAIKLNYNDFDEISQYAVEAVSYSYNHGIMKGKDNNIFAPKDIVVRAEAATVLYNLLKSHKV